MLIYTDKFGYNVLDQTGFLVIIFFYNRQTKIMRRDEKSEAIKFYLVKYNKVINHSFSAQQNVINSLDNRTRISFKNILYSV